MILLLIKTEDAHVKWSASVLVLSIDVESSELHENLAHRKISFQCSVVERRVAKAVTNVDILQFNA